MILLITRYIAVLLTSVGSRILYNRGILTIMFARGESAAVLAQIVVASGILNALFIPM